ncbi:uncharacterized protein TNCV_2151641 [Trichonephila clavipes]|uniref:Uncharacterized protein n=1 Tax=Trichonephila clavipes TaxID=2585209 RepID=A0A8X6R8C2_TRICX|nr:uncharacterized protein TNCV_2151641 [Trichonephila clavipes]
MEIRTGSSDSNSSLHESSSFESVQRRSNESQYGRKRSDVKHDLEEKVIRFLRKTKIKRSKKETILYKQSRESESGGPEMKIQNIEYLKEPSNSNTTTELTKFRKRGRTEETVVPSTGGYHLRPKNGRTIEMTTQEGGPVRARSSRGKHYIE